jgi:hypothetical protein
LLREALRVYRRERERKPRVDGVNLAPGCLYGVVVQESVSDLEGDLEEIKSELRWIKRLIVTTIVTARFGTVVRMAGWG